MILAAIKAIILVCAKCYLQVVITPVRLNECLSLGLSIRKSKLKIFFITTIAHNRTMALLVRLARSVRAHQARRALSYEFGVPTQPASGYNVNTIGSLLEASVAAVPDQTAMIVHHQGISKTYRQFNADVDRLVASLRAIGIKRGEKVGIWAVNCYEWLQLQYATAKIGAIYVNINPGYKEREFLTCANLIGIHTLVCNQSYKTNDFARMLENISPGILANARGCDVQSSQ